MNAEFLPWRQPGVDVPGISAEMIGVKLLATASTIDRFMSTFDGCIKEFPDITVDHFTRKPNRPIPRAAFLSHVHKDHLVGVETYDASFIYCSQATKELLLHLQTRRDRLNFAEGLIERKIFTYANLTYRKSLLKALPLNTPTRISLTSEVLTVTLFDANHCPGATMFLLESDSVAVLYTGDIRAERGWIRSISKNPLMTPYFSGIRQLDCLYLDTTFASVNDCTRDFPDRASSLQELIANMAKYPKSTIFHFNAWTLGYEDLWVAVASAFGFKVHVDFYRHELFRSIKSADGWAWGSFLNGHADRSQKKSGIADVLYEGVLTENANTRFHSCDSKGSCPIRDNANVVQIIPITTRMAIARTQADEEEIDISGLAGNNLKRKLELDNDVAKSPKRIKGLIVKEPGHSLLDRWWVRDKSRARPRILSDDDQDLSYYIHVPLSRHSSLNELRSLVALLKPRDIFPCVEDPEKLTYLDLEGCFGDLCNLTNSAYLRSRSLFTHANPDAALHKVLAERWAYDDMSEDDLDEEEVSSIATASPEPASEWNHSSCQTQVKECSEAVQDVVSANIVEQEEINLEEIKADNVDVHRDYSSPTQFPRGEEAGTSAFDDVLLYDEEISNADLINYYIEIACKGWNVKLKSVEGGGDEILL